MLKHCLLALAALFAAAGSPAQGAGAFEIKGLRIGMTEGEFKKLYPKATCGRIAGEPQKPPPGYPQSNSCSLSKFTLAGAETSSARVVFLDGRAAMLDVSIFSYAAKNVRDALTEKFGQPKPWGNDDLRGLQWSLGSIEMLIFSSLEGGNSLLSVESPASRSWMSQRDDARRKKSNADL